MRGGVGGCVPACILTLAAAGCSAFREVTIDLRFGWDSMGAKGLFF